MSTVAFEGIVLIAGGLRLYSRWKFEGELKLDDYLIVAALVCNTSSSYWNSNLSINIDTFHPFCLHGGSR